MERRLGGRLDAVLVVTVIVAAGLRLWGLGAQSLWYDAWHTTQAVDGGLGHLLRDVADREGVPPTYFLVMWPWVRVFGEGELALRSLSALAGIATVPVAYAAVALDQSRWVAADRRVAITLAAIGGAPVVAPLAIAVVGTDAFLGRYLIAALIPLLLAVAVGLGASRPAAPGLVAAAALVVASLVAVGTVAGGPELQRPDWRAVAAAVDASPGPRLVVVDVNGDQSGPLDHYLPSATRLGPADEAEVDGIDVLVALPPDRPCNMLVGHACGMVYLGAVAAAPGEPAFARTERIELDQFALDRYDADQPVTVTAATLVGPDAPGAVVWMVHPSR